MNTIIAGGSGFLGRALASVLTRASHEVTLLTRALPSGSVVRDPTADLPRVDRAGWVPDGTVGPWAHLIDGADVLVNLAGESIAGRRWAPAHKHRILESRINATRSLVAAIRAAERPPSVFVSGSAIGFYGDRGDEPLTEASTAGTDFLASVCLAWEAEAAAAASFATRIVTVRTGIVLARDEGALPQMARPFTFFAGGRTGTGRQFMSWIHVDDWVGLIRRAIEDEATGAMNATAPTPVRNAEFAEALAHALGRPCLVPAPALALRLVLGEMADALLLSSQRVLPARAQEIGYDYRYPELRGALESIY